MPTALARLRTLCLALPETHEVESHGEPTFRVGKKQFAIFASAGNHHGNGRDGVWIKTTHFTQDALVRAQPERFFIPPYVAHLGWVGAWLDDDPDWGQIDELLCEAYRMVAPKRLKVE